MRDTIDMARKVYGANTEWTDSQLERLKQFEALVRADERKAAQAEHEADKVIIEYHEATIKRLEAAILAEREACAKVCEEIYTGEEACRDWPTPEMCATAIRARGNA